MNEAQKRHAHRVVSNAYEKGELRPAPFCQECNGVNADGKRLSAHHWHGYDEDHILDIQWLCQACHARVHGAPASRTGHDVIALAQKMRDARATLSPERRSEIARKSWQTRLARYGNQPASVRIKSSNGGQTIQ